MADEKSLLVTVRANVADFNKQIGDAEKNFNRSFKNIQKMVDDTAQKFGILGGAITAGLGAATMKFGDYADNIADASVMTGVSIDKIQELAAAFKTEGMAITDVTTTLKFMQRNIADAAAGTETALAPFKALGISMAQLKSLSPDQQFRLIADALSKVQDPALKADLAMTMFGRSGNEIIPVINDGAAGLDNMAQKAKDLGLIMGTDAVKAGEAFQTKINLVKSQVDMLFVKLGEKAGFTNFIDSISKILDVVMKWIDQNPGLIKAIGEIGIGLLIAAGALKAFSIAMAVAKAMSGPAGWIQLAVGAAAALGSIALIESMTANNTGNAATTKAAVLSGGMTEAEAKALGIPGFAGGGIFKSPTLGLIGERGPEAVIPLPDLSGLSGNTIIQNFSFPMLTGDEMSRREIVRLMKQTMAEESNRSTFRPTQTQRYGGNYL